MNAGFKPVCLIAMLCSTLPAMAKAQQPTLPMVRDPEHQVIQASEAGIRDTQPDDSEGKKESYVRVPILGRTTTNGGAAVASDPPSNAEIFHALWKASERRHRELELAARQLETPVKVIKEKIADYVDPPRFYPLIGAAQLHHAHYKCSVFLTDALNDSSKQQPLDVVYVDHHHYHLVGNQGPVDDRSKATPKKQRSR